ncbi:SusC/RagA family TonB-linked outer membrane protein [Gelidibacter salicanalis]|uniref:SusC/RagA family TonB-linked outer membrane protein n=1 Tax=Gelidibacter salicanalis TaxID=291193 RepID=A0A934NJM6_9FLAO|nr:SusC/RagA family TonB-linked outer membrane protein [Gelidibacter salicanalis]MBJ7881624.1 SusC/RagA family TonB-linked outer membrane protein [Gelidibacter salicanalis]
MTKNHTLCRRRRIYAGCLFFLSLSLTLSAQDLLVSGQVTDGQLPISGANVLIKNSNTGVVSDFDGRYTITARPTDSLQISYLGYTTLTIPIQNRSTINITLQEDATALGEVQINAGYYTTTDREKTGSIARVTAKDMETQPITNPLAALQGRMAGVNITQNSGIPGGGFNIQIRGINSLRSNGNAPLYIVNGVPYSSQSLGSSLTSSGLLASATSPLNSINPSDIESIEVLKDADATAIYGSRGANGVVLITTKSGTSEKTAFSLQAFTSLGKVSSKMEMMDTGQYLAMRREAYANDGITSYPVNAYDINGVWSQTKNTDWAKELIGGTAYIKNLRAGMSGGNQQTRFLLSGTYRTESTVFPGDDTYAQAAVQSSVSHRSINDRFKVDLTLNYASNKSNIQANDLTTQAYRLAPNAPALYNEDGSLNWENGTFENPLANGLGKYTNRSKNLIANAVLSYSLAPNLEFRTSLGYNDMDLKEARTWPSTVYNPVYGVTSSSSILTLNGGTRNSWIVEPQLHWKHTWQDHELEVLLGTTFQSESTEMRTQRGTGFSSNGLINSIGAAATVQILAEQLSEYRYQAVFGRVNYKFKDRYIANLTGRRDGSSRFGPKNRFANFGAIGAAWIFSREKFLEKSSFLSFGKLRGSYGTTGSDQIGDYQFLDTYSVSNNLYNGVAGLQPTRLFSPNFGWETNTKVELAAELGFLKDRITLSSAWYQNRSSNQLVGIPLPATTGFNNIQANLDAVILNRGLEMELRTLNIDKKALSWSTTANLTIPNNRLLRFDGLEGSTYANTYVIGEPVDIIKGYHFTGIDADSGIYQFEDYNGDGLITSADRQFISDVSPQWFGGLNNRIAYKNWELEVLFQFVRQDGRNYIYSSNLPGTMTNMPIEVLDHWPANGENAEIQRYTTGLNSKAFSAYFRYRTSNAAISDASYIRLKSLSLTYKIPKNLLGPVSGSIYLQGQNLWTLTNYKGADPENQSLTFLPPLRQLTMGTIFNF